MKFNSVDLINAASYHEDIIFLTSFDVTRTLDCGKYAQEIKITKHGEYMYVDDGHHRMTVGDQDKLALSVSS